MTNVPERIREMWREVYVLFDKHFLMDVSKQENWEAFWKDSHDLIVKYEDVDSFIELIGIVSELIYKFAARRKANDSERYSYKKG